MMGKCVSIQLFRKLEEKVNRLLSLHGADAKLTEEEKRLMDEVSDDIKNKRKGRFVSISEL